MALGALRRAAFTSHRRRRLRHRLHRGLCSSAVPRRPCPCGLPGCFSQCAPDHRRHTAIYRPRCLRRRRRRRSCCSRRRRADTPDQEMSSCGVQVGPDGGKASLRHPFLRGLPAEHRPPGWEDDVAAVREWMATRPHLPPISDDYVLLFLHSCYMDVARTQTTIESYFTCKSRWPELFGNRDPLAPELQKILDFANLVPLPETTPEGYHVLLYRMVETDPSKMHFVTALRMFFMFNDVRLSENGLAQGYVVVFDMTGVSWGHLARVSLPAIRKFMIYIQDCHPARLKGVHIINTVAFIDRILALVKPLIKSDLLKLLHFHGPVDSLQRYMPLRILPEDYGGDAENSQTLHDAMRRQLETEYREWFIAEERIRVDFSKRPPKRNNDGRFGTRPPKGVVPPRPPAPEQGPLAIDEELGETASDFRHLAID